MEPIKRRSFVGSLLALATAPFFVPKGTVPARAVGKIPGWVEPQDVETWSGQPLQVYVDSLDPQDPKHQRLIKEVVEEYAQVLPRGTLWVKL